MKKSFLMVAAVAAMLVATGFTACKPNSKPKEIDIYVSGSERNGTKVVAKVWKNGKELYELTDGSKSAVANSVFVVGGDVYTAGVEGNVAKVWKNGEELYELADDGGARSIVVYNGDVYVAGFEKEGSSDVVKVWKNGKELYSLADKGNAYSIFIVERK